MRPPPDLPPDDLSQLTDDDLVLRARGPDRDRAWEELARRDQGSLSRLVAWLARRCGVFGADQDDLRQEAALAQLRAIHRYHLNPPDGPARYAFRRFCRRVVLRRLLTCLRSCRRAERHLDRSADATAILEVFPTPAGAGRGRAAFDSQPVWEAQQQEQQVRIAQALQYLDDWQRRLVDSLKGQVTRVEIAQERDLPYGVIRGEIERLKKKLQCWLADV
jgi:RNA polymerase sigma factor (sigma-70 family)